MAALHKLTLYNFRSYTERDFDFSSKVTVLTGKNGVGKTNVLEAVYVLWRGKSFRDGDEQLLNYNKEWWKVVGELDDHERELRYQPEQLTGKQLLVDGASKGRFSYRQALPIVLFEPEDLTLIHGSPSLRRAYLDNLLTNLLPIYRTNLARYERALLQRNNLLKKELSAQALRDAVFVWDIALAEYGAKIIEARLQLVRELNEKLSDYYSLLSSHTNSLVIDYSPPHPESHSIAQQLTKTIDKDRMRGFTGVGPHRDDICFLLDGKDARTSASRGEIRTILLALKYAELDLYTVRDERPLFLLDDVFSELDKDRQSALLAHTEDVQKIITTTHAPKRSGIRIIGL